MQYGLLCPQIYALSSDEEDEETEPGKSSKQTKKGSVDSDAESDKSDVQATRALIEKLSPAKPKAADKRVWFFKLYRYLSRYCPSVSCIGRVADCGA